MWIEREISPLLHQSAKERPVVLVTGARQTGKTSLCERSFSTHQFLSLDLPRLAEEAEFSGEEFLAKHPPPLVLDEVQYAPQLFRYLKHVVDKKRHATGLYVLTGSQKFNLMAGVTESLAGRAAIMELHSLSLRELERWYDKTAEKRLLLEWMFMGGYPELHAKRLDPERFYSDYMATYLERDVRQIIQVKNLRDFDRFMRLSALRTGQMLSLHSLASDVSVSPNTIKSWLSVLEASGIVHLLEPYYENLGKRLVKTPKLYFLDTGLACFLAGFRDPGELEKSAMLGALFETLVLGQMVRWHANRGKKAGLYFYRDHTGTEVDFVVPRGEKLKLYQCKWSENPQAGKGMHILTNLLGDKRILSKSLIIPLRGTRKRDPSLTIEDAVDLPSLEH